MQTVYVAGGAGFIGSHLCEALLQKDYEVVAIDNLITGSKDNIADLLSNPLFHFLEKNTVTIQKEDVQDVPKADFIFDLASPASPNPKAPKSFINLPIETLLANSQGTKNLLDIAKEMNARFVYTSTSEVYGDPLVSPQSEEYWGNVNPHGVRSVYDEGKRFSEALIMAYVRKYNVDARIARVFNTYGPHMQIDDGRVVSNFIVASVKNDPLIIFGEGKQTRSFCYVSDLVRGLMALMFINDLRGEVINLGNPLEKTINDFAKLIQELTHTQSQIVHESPLEDDPQKRRPDIAKAKRLLQWEPVVSLEEGVQKTIDYFKQSME